MKEASLVKYYFAKYFFLAFGLLQWTISVTFLMNQGSTPKGQWSAFLFFTIGLILMSMQIVIGARFKRVAIGKKKIATRLKRAPITICIDIRIRPIVKNKNALH